PPAPLLALDDVVAVDDVVAADVAVALADVDDASLVDEVALAPPPAPSPDEPHATSNAAGTRRRIRFILSWYDREVRRPESNRRLRIPLTVRLRPGANRC